MLSAQAPLSNVKVHCSFSMAVVFFVRTKLGRRILNTLPDLHGVVGLVYPQSFGHGNKVLEEGDVELPLLDQRSSTFKQAAKIMWDDYGVLACLLNCPLSQRMCLEKKANQDFQKMKGNIGPCARVGLLTGGGLPFGEFAVSARSLKCFHDLFQLCATQAGRWVEGVPYYPVEEGLPALPAGVQHIYKGLPEHTDNNVVKGAPEVYHLQGSVSLFPVPSGFLRLTALCGFQAPTDYQQRQQLLALATRTSRAEDGRLGKGPLERPKPGAVLGGPFLKLVEAQKLSNDELKHFIQEKCPPYMVALLPSKFAADGLDKAIAQVCKILGPPIFTTSAFMAEMGKVESDCIRSLLMRALLGGVDQNFYANGHTGVPVKMARNVFEHFKKTWDPMVILNWAGNSGRHKRKVGPMMLQPCGIPAKKLKH